MTQQKTDFFIRMAAPADTRECRDIDVEAWGEDGAATEEMLLARIERFPIGNFVAIDRSTGRIVGSVWSLATKEGPLKDWWTTSGEGTYDGVADLHADFAIGINLSVKKGCNGLGIGEALVVRLTEVSWGLGKRRAVLGARMPEYRSWSPHFAPEHYIRMSRAGGKLYYRDPDTGFLHEGPEVDDVLREPNPSRIDPRSWTVTQKSPTDLRLLDGELSFFLGIQLPFGNSRILGLLPDYFPDPDSLNYAALIGWYNEDHIDHDE